MRILMGNLHWYGLWPLYAICHTFNIIMGNEWIACFNWNEHGDHFTENVGHDYSPTSI